MHTQFDAYDSAQKAANIVKIFYEISICCVIILSGDMLSGFLLYNISSALPFNRGLTGDIYVRRQKEKQQ